MPVSLAFFFPKKLEFFDVNSKSTLKVLLRKQTPAIFVDTSGTANMAKQDDEALEGESLGECSAVLDVLKT